MFGLKKLIFNLASKAFGSRKSKQVDYTVYRRSEGPEEVKAIYSNGVTKLRFPLRNGKSKFTTTFPEDWDRETVLQIVAGSLKDISHVEYDADGCSSFIIKYYDISISVIVSNQGILKTFFPLKPAKIK